MMKSIKMIFIDWNKTLSDSLFWEQLGNKDHKYHDYHSKMINWLFVENRGLINPWMRGESTTEEIISRMSKEIGLKEKVLINELEVSCRNMKFLDKRILKHLERIKEKGIKLVVATDNMDTFARYTIPGLNLEDIFDDFLVSSELGCLKKDIRSNRLCFFHDYMLKNNLDYKEVVLIDDCIDRTGIYDKLGFKTDQVTKGDTAEILEKYAY